MRPIRGLPQGAEQNLRDAVIPFDGGLDQKTPAWRTKPGTLREAKNYERDVAGGYRDIVGYERFDGQPAPSDATYAILNVTISGSFTAGDTITGATSGDTAEVVAVVTDSTPNYLVITKYTGTFTDGEDLEVSSTVEGVASGTSAVDGAATSGLAAQYANLAADAYRSDIAAVPGEGSVLGVWMLQGDVYAFRNATGGATAKMYKGTASGWSEVDLGEQIDFTSGSEEPAEGDTLDGATSGASATVERVILTSGTWAGGDAAGYMILSGVTGTFQAENLDINGGTANVMTIGGDSTAITLNPDGKYRFYNSKNFNSSGTVERMYGADGVNRGFEFDGSVFVPIRTGMTDDTPDHVIVHRGHLFFAFGNVVQYSGINQAYSWTILTGANEIAADYDVTGFQREPGTEGNAALLVATKERLYMLYGASSADFQLVPYRDEVGCAEDSLQQGAQSLFFDIRGITMLRSAQEFGNFQHSTLSQIIQPFINAKRGLIAGSCIVREKNQYRVFFTDNTALYCTLQNDKIAAFMPVEMDHLVTCICSEEDASTGAEEIYFGSDDGFVYQMERGTSFDGAAIDAFMRLHFTNDNVRTEKEYHHVTTIEATGSGYAEIIAGYELEYGLADRLQPSEQTAEIAFSSDARWDSGLFWDAGLFWDGKTLAPTGGLDIRGRGENISFMVRKNSDYMSPVTLTGIHYRYSTRRRMRGR